MKVATVIVFPEDFDIDKIGDKTDEECKAMVDSWERRKHYFYEFSMKKSIEFDGQIQAHNTLYVEDILHDGYDLTPGSEAYKEAIVPAMEIVLGRARNMYDLVMKMSEIQNQTAWGVNVSYTWSEVLTYKGMAFQVAISLVPYKSFGAVRYIVVVPDRNKRSIGMGVSKWEDV